MFPPFHLQCRQVSFGFYTAPNSFAECTIKTHYCYFDFHGVQHSSTQQGFLERHITNRGVARPLHATCSVGSANYHLLTLKKEMEERDIHNPDGLPPLICSAVFATICNLQPIPICIKKKNIKGLVLL